MSPMPCEQFLCKAAQQKGVSRLGHRLVPCASPETLEAVPHLAAPAHSIEFVLPSPPPFNPPACRFLPQKISIIGYARSKLSDEDLREKIRPQLKADKEIVDEFLDLLTYISGPYDAPEGFQKLNKALSDLEAEDDGAPSGRMFYLALPPSVYPQVPLLQPEVAVHEVCQSESGAFSANASTAHEQELCSGVQGH